MVYSKESLAIIGFSLSFVITSVKGQGPGFVPLAAKKFAYNDIVGTLRVLSP